MWPDERGSKAWWGEQQQVVLFAGPEQENQAENPWDACKEVASRVTLDLTRWMDSPILADCSDSGIGERWHTTEVGIYEKNAPV